MWPCSSSQRLQREQGVETLRPRLADADQDPARERDRELAGEPDRLEPHRRHLVGRRPVRPALQRQPVGDGLEHDPHRRRHRTEQLELAPAHHARIQVGQQPCLVEHPAGAVRQVLDRRREAELRQLVTRDAVAQLGLVAEREQRLRAAGGRSRASDLEHLVDGEEGALTAARRARERAVAADIAAQRRQRYEHLGRVRDESPVAQRPRLGHEVGKGRAEDLGDEVCHR